MLRVLTRRFPMKRTVFVAAFALLVAFSAPAQPTNHNEETVAQFQAEMAAGKLTTLPLLLLHQWVVGAGRTDPQPVLARSQRLRLQLRFGGSGVRELCGGLDRLRD